MASQQQKERAVTLPSLPAKHADWISYVSKHPDTPMSDLIAPYKEYDSKLREIFAQHPEHPAISEANVVPIFAGNEQELKIRARNLAAESEAEAQRYIIPLKNADRKPNGSPATVESLKVFQTNFQLFSESSLVDMDWSNVVVAGSAVVTSLLPVPPEHNESKRALREYYHQKLAPASDVDLFLYDLTEEQAVEKIKQIEQRIRDSILTETTTIRTKNAITVASQHPTRHVQIVLRIYRSISEILTGFDVDCACAAYDGKQVYASPRALAAYMTQINTIDLTRRSPSYENRLSKYSHRGFEIYWSQLDRSRVDPTIFERSFGRTLGLARLLVLEKLPKNADREAYVDQRRSERGRPFINRFGSRALPGNMKEEYDDEVAEWEEGDQISDYNTFTIPYGPRYHAKKIERLLYAKDLLLNAEWNRPKDRETNLHRHPAFFGYTEDVLGDCCGHCPKPTSDEDKDIAEEEGKIYISGNLTFIKDDPGRQAIGSFNPLTDEDWTEMAYVGNTARLCQAIVDKDLEGVQDWLKQEGANPDTRDYTGRAPLHLAVTSSTPEIVQCLIDAGARMVARLVDGKTALHLAAMCGEAAMIKALLVKSEANEEVEAEKQAAKRAARKATENGDEEMVDTTTSQLEASKIESEVAVSEDDDEDVDMMDDDESEEVDATTEDSAIRIDKKQNREHEHLPDDADTDEPDVYDVNVLAWDIPASPLHFAIANGHIEAVKVLVEDFGADVLLPIKFLNDYNKQPRASILPLVLALQLPQEKSEEMTKLLISLGASPSQADIDNATALQYCTMRGADVLKAMISANRPAAQRAVNHLSMSGHQYNPTMQNALQLAIQCKDIAGVEALLDLGAKAEVDFATYVTSYQSKWSLSGDAESNEKQFRNNYIQPVLTAVDEELPSVVPKLLDAGADVNTLNNMAWQAVQSDNNYYNRNQSIGSLLDAVQGKMIELNYFLETGEAKHTYHGYFYRPYNYSNDHVPPKPLKEDSEYLKDLDSGSYAHCSSTVQLEDAKLAYERDLKNYEEHVKNKKPEEGVEAKKNAVKSLLTEFEDLESKLLDRGAKTFKELYPDMKLPEDSRQHSNTNQAHEAEPWKPKLTFQLPDLTDERRAAYVKLFQACWSGELSTIKELCLSIWDEDQSPLKIAVKDRNNFSPLSIAILRKHFDVAKAILEIAHAQYAPEEKSSQAKYSVQPKDPEDSDSDDGDDHGIQIYSEIMDDRFTIEDIGEVQSQVKSDVTPLQFLCWACPVSRFFEDNDPSAPTSSGHDSFEYSNSSRRAYGRHRQLRSAGRQPYQVLKHARNMRSYRVYAADSNEYFQAIFKPGNLFQLAISHDDPELLHFLIAMGEDYSSSKGDVANEAQSKFFRFNDQDFLYAIRLGRLQLLEEIIIRTGAGIPLDDLVQKSGVEVTEEKGYYQGLSVHGEKRADWANAGRDESEPPKVQRPPLLHAARLGSLESVEWFMSDAATRCYNEFAENNRGDKRIQNLAKATGGLDASISTWLNLRSKLIMHCVVLGKTTEASLDLLRHLCKKAPELLQQNSASGMTPLHLAFALHRKDMIKALLEAGADQTCRNKAGDNIVHSILTYGYLDAEKRAEQIRSMLNLVDKRLLPTLFAERTSADPGAATPLARWLHNHYKPQGYYNSDKRGAEEILDVILEFSKGEDLAVINGEGDTPLHAAVRYKSVDLLRQMLECRPELLFRENGVGRTPLEMVEDAYLAREIFNDPPILPQNNNTYNRHRNNRYFQRTSHAMCTRKSSEFVKEEEIPLSDNEEMWDLVQEYAQEAGTTKRRLVSLIEASEVAKRLASRKSSRDKEEEGEESDEVVEDEEKVKGDEVAVWFQMALNLDN